MLVTRLEQQKLKKQDEKKIHKIINLSFKKAFSITIRTYGLGILLWFVFAMVIEINFS